MVARTLSGNLAIVDHDDFVTLIYLLKPAVAQLDRAMDL
jgi:hypothetical protein